MNLRLLPLVVAAVLGVFSTVVALVNGWWWLALVWVLVAAFWLGLAPHARKSFVAYLRGDDGDGNS